MSDSSFIPRFIHEILEENRLADGMAVNGYSDCRLRLMMRDYYRACKYEESSLRTIAVENTSGLALLIPMVIRDKQLSYYGMPASPAYVNHLNEMERRSALEAAYCMAVEYCLNTGNGLTIATPSTHCSNHKLANWEMKILKAGGYQKSNYRGYVTIGETESVFFGRVCLCIDACKVAIKHERRNEPQQASAGFLANLWGSAISCNGLQLAATVRNKPQWASTG